MQQIPSRAIKTRKARRSGFIAFLDVVFASIGIFVVILVIQDALVRAEQRNKPAEADLYAVLLPDNSIADTIADIKIWRDLGRAGEYSKLSQSAWLDRVIALSLQGQRIVKIEIAHGANAIDLRLKLESAMNAIVKKGVGAGNTPPFTVVWRPLAADDDWQAYLNSRAFIASKHEAK